MDENEFLKPVQEGLERLNEYDKKTSEANKKNRNEILDLVKLVNKILTRHNATGKINRSHIRFYADFIGNIIPPIRDNVGSP